MKLRCGPATVTEQKLDARALRSHWRESGRRIELLGSQETSLRSRTSTALVERGSRHAQAHRDAGSRLPLGSLLRADRPRGPDRGRRADRGKVGNDFEGPVLVEPDGARATSDSQSRRCDGIDPLDPENVVPEPTPPSASADALGLIGETFDGRWYPSFDDYFVTRWGPDLQNPAEGAYWGILVNDTFTDVGGCQYQLDDGDEVLWVYDAFQGRPNLALFPEVAHYASGPRPLTATAELNQPFTVEAAVYEDNEEDHPPAAPGASGPVPSRTRKSHRW